jgi:FkbM family methyltransferase
MSINKRRINIGTSCDDRYAKFVLVNLANIDATFSSEYEVHFYLMQSRISEANLKLIADYATTLQLSFHNVHVSGDEFLGEITRHSRASDYERFYDGVCHLFLPEDVDRILYIDTGDVLLLDSDYPFYFRDFEDKSLLVSTYWNLPASRWDFSQIGLWGGFNSGHILINVERLRRLSLKPEDYIDYVKSWAKSVPDAQVLFGGDQAFLTGFFAGDISVIEKPNPYNVRLWPLNGEKPELEPKSIHFNAMFKNLKPWHIPFNSPKDLDRYKISVANASKKQPFKVHFAGYENECIAKWWDLCKRTPAYQELKQKSFTDSRFAIALCQHIREGEKVSTEELKESSDAKAAVNPRLSDASGVSSSTAPVDRSVGRAGRSIAGTSSTPKERETWNSYQFALIALFSTMDRLKVVQVGANDGVINDPLFPVMSQFPDRTDIILIEPQKVLLEPLRTNYSFHPNPIIHNGAIGPAGNLRLYGVRREFWKNVTASYARGWPDYRAPTGIVSTDREKVASWAERYLDIDVPVEYAIETSDVDSLPLTAVLDKYSWAHNIDVLQIDAEGFDDKVIYQSSVEHTQPKLISFEAKFITGARYDELVAYLGTHGYRVVRTNKADALAIRKSPPNAVD